MSSDPMLAPLILKVTPATPTLSEALAETEIVPLTVAPLLGEVMETVGGMVSAGVMAPTEIATRVLDEVVVMVGYIVPWEEDVRVVTPPDPTCMLYVEFGLRSEIKAL